MAAWNHIRGSAFQRYTSAALKGHMDERWSMYGLPWLPIDVAEEHVSPAGFCLLLISAVSGEGARGGGAQPAEL